MPCVQQKQAEMEEEFIVNKLMKRLDQLKREKQVLANEVHAHRSQQPALTA